MNDTTMLNDGFITTKEASKLFKYTSSYLAHLVRTEKINGHRLGRSWIIEKDSLLRFIAQREKQDTKYTPVRVYPEPQEQQTQRTLRVPIVTVPSIGQDSVLQSRHSVSDNFRLPKLSPKWIAGAFIGMFFVFGATVFQTSMASQSMNTLRSLPGSISRIPLSLGEFVISTAHAVIAADVALAYGIAMVAPVTAQGTVKILISIGDSLSNDIARIPTQVASVLAHDTL